MMTSIADAINKLILDTWGGIVAFWIVVGAFFAKICGKTLGWCGKKLLEGAIGDLADRIFDKIIQYIDAVFSKINEKFDKIDQRFLEMERKLDNVEDNISSYRTKKHKIEAELAEVKDAVKNNDSNKLVVLRQYYNEIKNDE